MIILKSYLKCQNCNIFRILCISTRAVSVKHLMLSKFHYTHYLNQQLKKLLMISKLSARYRENGIHIWGPWESQSFDVSYRCNQCIRFTACNMQNCNIQYINAGNVLLQATWERSPFLPFRLAVENHTSKRLLYQFCLILLNREVEIWNWPNDFWNHSKWLGVQNGCCFDRLRHRGRSPF